MWVVKDVDKGTYYTNKKPVNVGVMSRETVRDHISEAKSSLT